MFRILRSGRVGIPAALVAAGVAAALWATVLNARLTTGAVSDWCCAPSGASVEPEGVPTSSNPASQYCA